MNCHHFFVKTKQHFSNHLLQTTKEKLNILIDEEENQSVENGRMIQKTGKNIQKIKYPKK